MKQNEVSMMKDEIRKNVEALIPEFKEGYCTLEIESNNDNQQKYKFYISHSSTGEGGSITIIEHATFFQELLEIVIVRARALAGQYE